MPRVLKFSFAALLGMALVPGAAQAATVRVVEETVSSVSLEERATLIFEAAPGELNDLRIDRVGEEAGRARYDVHDLGTNVAPGEGCRVGGDPSVAICLMPFSRPATCGHLGCTDRGREITFLLALGDGDDMLTTRIPADDGGHGSVVVDVDGGEGTDNLVTGPTADRINPGPGADTVHAWEGDDFLDAGDSPDGADVFDLGAGFDTVSYARTTVPVNVSLDGRPNDGPAGERDAVLGTEAVGGGPAADRLVGSDARGEHGPEGFAEELWGGGGGDVLIGKGGSDLLRTRPLVVLARPARTVDADAVLRGGPGNDQLEAANGADVATGGRGDDAVSMFAGDDRARGGPGRDFVNGGRDADRLAGDRGRDQLDAGVGLVDEEADGAVDHLDCGPSRRDQAFEVERDDVARNCERVSTNFVKPARTRPR